MGSFNEQSLQERASSDLTEQAEASAMAFYSKDGLVVKYGLSWKGMIEKVEWKYLPSVIRKTPDLLWISRGYTYFVEVKAVKDFWYFKLKDLVDYAFWDKHVGARLVFFIKSPSESYSVSYSDVTALLNGSNTYPIESFSDGPKYFRVPLSAIESFKIKEVV